MCLSQFRQEKRAQRLSFWVRRPPGGVGVFHAKGVVAKNFVPALETLSSLGFEERNPGCPGNFAGMSRTPGGVQKVCAKKLRAHFSFPNSLLHMNDADIALQVSIGTDAVEARPLSSEPPCSLERHACMYACAIVSSPYQCSSEVKELQGHAAHELVIKLRNQEQGVLAKGVSAEWSVTPKETKRTPKHRA